MTVISPEDADLRVRQDMFVDQLQVLEPNRPIEVQHYENDKWHVRSSCEEKGCESRPLWTRGILQSEVVYDFDEPDYGTNAKYATMLVGTLNEAVVPHHVFSSGAKGVHVMVYLRLPAGIAELKARDVRSSVWQHFLETSGLWGVVKIDPKTVRWEHHSMVHAWGHVRRAPYAFMEQLSSTRPTRAGRLPPRPRMWDPSDIPGAREIIEKPEDVHHQRPADPTFFQAHAVDLRDFAHFPWIRDMLTPATDHDEALVGAVLLTKFGGMTEDECVAFMAASWAPIGPCSTRTHQPGPENIRRVRDIFRSKFSFRPDRGYKLLKSWGKPPDRVVWDVLFKRVPLSAAPGEMRRTESCGQIKWVVCASCSRQVPIETHCRATIVCPECQQYRYVVAATRFKDNIEDRFAQGMSLYVLGIPIPVTKNWADVKALEAKLRQTIDSTADVEILRTIMPDRIVYTSFAPFKIGAGVASPVRTFGKWLRRVVLSKSYRLTFLNEPDVDQAVDAWDTSTHRAHLFQSFGWRHKDGTKDRTFKVGKRGPVQCPYCGGPLFAPWSPGGGEDVRDRTERRRHRTGYGPPR